MDRKLHPHSGMIVRNVSGIEFYDFPLDDAPLPSEFDVHDAWSAFMQALRSPRCPRED